MSLIIIIICLNAWFLIFVLLILVLNTTWACFGHGFVRLTACKSVFALTKTKSTSNFNMKFSPSYEFYEYIFGHNFTLKKAVFLNAYLPFTYNLQLCLQTNRTRYRSTSRRTQLARYLAATALATDGHVAKPASCQAASSHSNLPFAGFLNKVSADRHTCLWVWVRWRVEEE